MVEILVMWFWGRNCIVGVCFLGLGRMVFILVGFVGLWECVGYVVVMVVWLLWGSWCCDCVLIVWVMMMGINLDYWFMGMWLV